MASTWHISDKPCDHFELILYSTNNKFYVIVAGQVKYDCSIKQFQK